MKNSSLKIDIVLATYNGSNYLAEQLESLLSQTHKNLRILIRDDGSSDNTVEIIHRFIFEHPDFIELIDDEASAGSAQKNFAILLSHSDANYVMCCDQDDIWMPHKVESLLQIIIDNEHIFSKDTPLLVHADLTIVDSNLQIIHPSMWKYQNIIPKSAQHFNRLLTQNSVTGCTLIINRALLNFALPIPDSVAMHDWWLALIACSFGKIVSVEESFTLYRQHSSNVVGSTAYTPILDETFLKRISNRQGVQKTLELGSSQATAFGIRFPNSKSANTALEFSYLHKLPSVQKRISIVKNGFWMMGLLRNISWFLRV